MDLELMDPLSRRAPDPPVHAGPGTLVVQSLALHGGQTAIRGERADFARIVLSGVRFDEEGVLRRNAPKQTEAAVLILDDAEALCRELHKVVNRRVRSSATPSVVARGTWSWRSEPPRADDLFVTRFTSGDNCELSEERPPAVYLDLAGALMFEAGRRDEPVSRRAVFPVLRHVQVLTSCLVKCAQGVRLSREWSDPGLSITWREVGAPRRFLQPWERRERYLAEEAAR